MTLWEIFNKTMTIQKTEYVPPETVAIKEVVGRCQNVVCYSMLFLARYYKKEMTSGKKSLF